MMRVLIGIPTYDNTVNASLLNAILNETRSPDTPPFVVADQSLSLLAYGCNRLWCAALNGRATFTHFLMVHSDVIPQAVGWIAKLVREMETAQADILSAAIPIKDERGLVSTALLHSPEHPGWGVGGAETRRRVTLREMEKLPNTFAARDVASVFGWNDPDPCLLANTGLMLVDLRGRWVEKCYFTVRDIIWRGEDGLFYCDVEPEDWFFTRRAHEHGARVCVTQTVRVKHTGRASFPNWGAWGTFAEDGKPATQAEPETAVRYRTLRKQIAAFTGDTEAEIDRRAREGMNPVAAAWRERNPQSADEVRAFYGDRENGYLYHLLLFNCMEGYQHMLDMLRRRYADKKVLVFGAGLGTEAEVLAEKNNVTAFDVPGVLHDFARSRLNGKVHWLDGERFTLLQAPRNDYDVVVALDVLEHIHPDEFDVTMDVLANALSLGGELFCHNVFHDEGGKNPTHFDHSVRFAEWTQRNGFQRVDERNSNSEIWRKA